MSDDPPIVHVLRPVLPWREDRGRTECGLPPANHPVITRAEFLIKVKREGQRRAMITTCQTCLDTAGRHPSWEEDPVRCLGREVDHYGWGRRADPVQFRQELIAIALLVQRHRAEFSELMEDQAAIVGIDTAKRKPGPQ